MATRSSSSVKPYDGRYELVLPYEFTQREWGWAKRLAGYLPGNVDEGLDGYDAELIGVMALVALYRAGKIARARTSPECSNGSQDLTLGGHQPRTDEPNQEETDAGPPPQSSSENGSYFWARVADELGDISGPADTLWHPQLGYFGVSPDDIGDMTPAQLLACVDMFDALHGGGDG